MYYIPTNVQDILEMKAAVTAIRQMRRYIYGRGVWSHFNSYQHFPETQESLSMNKKNSEHTLQLDRDNYTRNECVHNEVSVFLSELDLEKSTAKLDDTADLKNLRDIHTASMQEKINEIKQRFHITEEMLSKIS